MLKQPQVDTKKCVLKKQWNFLLRWMGVDDSVVVWSTWRCLSVWQLQDYLHKNGNQIYCRRRWSEISWVIIHSRKTAARAPYLILRAWVKIMLMEIIVSAGKIINAIIIMKGNLRLVLIFEFSGGSEINSSND